MVRPVRVRVHLNLTRAKAGRPAWTIKPLEGPDRGRVTAHLSHVTLTDVTFRVSEAQRLWCIAHKARQVHAWCEGSLCEAPDLTPPVGAGRFTYNPFRAPLFHVAGAVDRTLSIASRVSFIGREAFFTT